MITTNARERRLSLELGEMGWCLQKNTDGTYRISLSPNSPPVFGDANLTLDQVADWVKGMRETIEDFHPFLADARHDLEALKTSWRALPTKERAAITKTHVRSLSGLSSSEGEGDGDKGD